MPLGESRVPSREVHISGMHNKEANTEVTKKAVILEIEKKVYSGQKSWARKDFASLIL